MTRRKQRVLVVLTAVLSCVLLLYLAVIKTYSSSFTHQSRSSEPWYDYDDWSMSGEPYSYSGSVAYPSPTPDVDPTCRALQQLAGPTGLCTPNDLCNGVHCTVSDVGTFDLTVEPCHNPPAIDVVGRDNTGSVVFNETITQSRQEPLGLGTTLDVNVEQSPNEDAIIISVTLHVFGSSVPLVPKTRIPLNRQQCSFTPHTPTASQSITTRPQPTPMPTPSVNPTCQTLQQLADTLPGCSVSDQCSGVECTIPLVGSFDLTVQPCNNPPAVHVVGRDRSGTVIFDEVLTNSHQESLGFGTSLNITIEHSPKDDSIVVSVDYISTVSGTVPIIPKTRIPLNREQCGRSNVSLTTATVLVLSSTQTLPPLLATTVMSTALSSTQAPPRHSSILSMSPQLSTSTPGLPPTKPPAGTGQSLTVAVAVPITIVFCLVGVAVIVVAILLEVRRRKRRRREYHFQRMTFSDDKDDDDDDEDL